MKKIFIFGGAGVAILFGLGIYFYLNYIDYQYSNRKVCIGISPGITVDGIRGLMQPNYVSRGWVFFSSIPFGVGAIRAKIGSDGVRVVELRCWEDGPPSWKIED